MRIKLLVARAGPTLSQNPGEEIEVGAAEAARMIAAGQAVALAAPPPKRRARRETAAKRAAKPETADR
ncbi:MAG: hypothetical protein ACJA1L_000168 [Paracoccaceae bacterium]|jgi:hypothetical protein